MKGVPINNGNVINKIFIIISSRPTDIMNNVSLSNTYVIYIICICRSTGDTN